MVKAIPERQISSKIERLGASKKNRATKAGIGHNNRDRTMIQK